MKLLLTSDLHAGFSNKTIVKLEHFFDDVAEVIEEEGVSALLIAGDHIACKQRSLQALWRTIRNRISIPVIICYGNHDFWSDPKIGYEQIKATHHELEALYDITHVEKGKLLLNDVAVVGFDGWYGHLDPPTNDRKWMLPSWAWAGDDPFHFLQKKAHHELERVLDIDLSDVRASVCLTHFPTFTEHIQYAQFCAPMNWHPFLRDRFDVVCVGHSHKAADFTENSCRFLNAGGDYDAPKFVLFDV